MLVPERVTPSDIRVGWVLSIPKSGEFSTAFDAPDPTLRCDFAGWGCGRYCNLEPKGYGHPAAVVKTERKSHGKIAVSFVQFTRTQRLGSIQLHWTDMFLGPGVSYFQAKHVYTVTMAEKDDPFHFFTYPRQGVEGCNSIHATARYLEMNPDSLQQLLLAVDSRTPNLKYGQNVEEAPASIHSVASNELEVIESEAKVDLQSPATRPEQERELAVAKPNRFSDPPKSSSESTVQRFVSANNGATVLNGSESIELEDLKKGIPMDSSISRPTSTLTTVGGMQKPEEYKSQAKPEANIKPQALSADTYGDDIEAQRLPGSQLEASRLSLRPSCPLPWCSMGIYDAAKSCLWFFGCR